MTQQHLDLEWVTDYSDQGFLKGHYNEDAYQWIHVWPHQFLQFLAYLPVLTWPSYSPCKRFSSFLRAEINFTHHTTKAPLKSTLSELFPAENIVISILH